MLVAEVLINLSQEKWTYQIEYFDSDGFQCADFLRSAVRILDPQLERRLPVVADDVSLG